MILANYHTHTVRCKHAVGTEREYIEAAISEGFKILGFTDHRWYPCDRFFKMAAAYSPRYVIGCDAHTPKIVRQPEHIDGFDDFLVRNGIECGDNIIDITGDLK